MVNSNSHFLICHVNKKLHWLEDQHSNIKWGRWLLSTHFSTFDPYTSLLWFSSSIPEFNYLLSFSTSFGHRTESEKDSVSWPIAQRNRLCVVCCQFLEFLPLNLKCDDLTSYPVESHKQTRRSRGISWNVSMTQRLEEFGLESESDIVAASDISKSKNPHFVSKLELKLPKRWEKVKNQSWKGSSSLAWNVRLGILTS